MNQFCRENPTLCEELKNQPLTINQSVRFNQPIPTIKKKQSSREYLTKETPSTQSSNFKTPIRLFPTKPLKANIKELSPERLEQANLVEASKIAHFSGYDEASKYLKSKGIDYYIDRNLSTPESLVLIKPQQTGSIVKIVYRGTDVSNVVDLASDVAIAKGIDRQLPQYQRGDAQLRKVIAEYGKPKELIGFSLGGNRAISLGTTYKIPVQAFNPFIGPRVIKDLRSDFGVENVNITRTPDDIASLGLAYTKARNIEIINPLVDSLNPITSHSLKNFLTNEPRETPNVNLNLAKGATIGSSLLAGYAGEQTLKHLERITKLKPTNKVHSVASGFLGGVYTLPFIATAPVAELIPIVPASAISSLAGYTASQNSTQPFSRSSKDTKIKAGVGGATSGAVGAGSLVLADAIFGSEIGSVLGPEGIVIGAFVGGLIGEVGSLL